MNEVSQSIYQIPANMSDTVFGSGKSIRGVLADHHKSPRLLYKIPYLSAFLPE